jgi:sugar-specific transcriptional regulator TrmB
MDDEDAIEGLTRLGLTTYEARVFLALQKLDTGTASEVAEVSEVPRSQVYGTADDLEQRGLIEIQETRPAVYRPVDPDTAEQRLLEQLESTGRRAFGYLQDVRGQFADGDDESEALWTVRGTDSIRSRTVELIREADSRIVYGAEDPEQLGPAIRSALSDAAADGRRVVVVSKSAAVLDAIEDDAIETVRQPADHLTDISTARLLIADEDTILLSVAAPDSDRHHEIAFWSDGTAFAHALARISFEMFGTEPL